MRLIEENLLILDELKKLKEENEKLKQDFSEIKEKLNFWKYQRIKNSKKLVYYKL